MLKNYILSFILLFFSASAFAELIKLPSLMSYPSQSLKGVDSKKNKVLIFLSRTCPCTQQNIPYLNTLAKDFPEMEFIGVHSKKGAPIKEINEIIAEFHPAFPVLDDKDLEVANLLKANRTPQVVILGPDNNVIYSGGVTDRTNPQSAKKFYLKNALTQLSQNTEITEKETRSLGCIILR